MVPISRYNYKFKVWVWVSSFR